MAPLDQDESTSLKQQFSHLNAALGPVSEHQTHKVLQYSVFTSIFERAMLLLVSLVALLSLILFAIGLKLLIYTSRCNNSVCFIMRGNRHAYYQIVGLFCIPCRLAYKIPRVLPLFLTIAL